MKYFNTIMKRQNYGLFNDICTNAVELLIEKLLISKIDRVKVLENVNKG